MTSLRERHDELQESFTTELRNAMDSTRNELQGARAENRETLEKLVRAQRELKSLVTQNAEMEKTLADYQEKVNTLSTNNSKFVTEQMTELEKRTADNLAESRGSMMRGFESDLMRIAEEITHELMTPQIDSKSAETADRLRRIMGSLIELNMRIEKQEDLMSDHKLQKNIRGLVDEIIRRSLDADRLEHREMISQLYKKMNEVVNAMHYPKYYLHSRLELGV
ncbi:conserved hypothetical protein [Perkinsus marinus ATCC 50983]|uniref:Uncharacterized protein n=1 Tax=Perkinsus marinus (strain ATCC 50983 / TXsc) TaxID=423536 RepID=C5KRL3_PERM5|nr:conserved hypothetical protein [Perkinsus marinus ATCC 50983]EER12875.1 conserved hypothetical protein [Perkinsus marinus ATCC 50983]|eukprot:XP_002781080.1 conserved hypothetical protein [Perkinsus marinus ATCC 50983]